MYLGHIEREIAAKPGLQFSVSKMSSNYLNIVLFIKLDNDKRQA
jgi:hypothetical protein